LTPQTPFDLGDQGCGGAQVLESLLQDLGGVLYLAAITCEALLRLQATVLSGYGVTLRHVLPGLPAFFSHPSAV
jgi:hypothetical protein